MRITLEHMIFISKHQSRTSKSYTQYLWIYNWAIETKKIFNRYLFLNHLILYAEPERGVIALDVGCQVGDVPSAHRHSHNKVAQNNTACFHSPPTVTVPSAFLSSRFSLRRFSQVFHITFLFSFLYSLSRFHLFLSRCFYFCPDC